MLDREPLGLVAGERVGVRDVAGVEVARGQREPAAVVELDARSRVARGRRRLMVPRLPLAIPRRRSLRVQRTRSPTASSSPGVEAESVAAEPSVAVEEGAGGGVELGDVGAAVGDHRAAGEVAAGGPPPVGNQLRLRLDAVGGDGQPAVLGGVGEVVAAAAVAEQGERAPFELVALAAVVVELDRAVALDDRAEQAARADGGKLGRVADEHRLPLGALDLERGRG